ncbi:MULTISPECIES: hypothetical protein [Haloferax]|uniref:DUF7992 domain-containing protein n=2 Tax=Haloferax TaxID=2251 RepID=A0A6G1Z4K2_9EURY|nr:MULTISPECIES: hypothetical protein [Haloferax]KAB1188776.1 hypothetical protein Hfx1149_12315 [Haloferax sp. CBA1149]MRW81489.1 hypothetical protein [Haloferax marinisediminis]
MSLPETPPDPPSVYDGHDVDEYHTDAERRAEIQTFFELENAWGEAYEQWLEETLLTEQEYETALELGLFDKLDFYWDTGAGNVEYEIPPIVDGGYDLPLDTASDIEEELDEFAQIVADTLTEYYLDWGPTDDPDSEYHQLFGDQYNAADDVLTDDQEGRENA